MPKPTFYICLLFVALVLLTMVSIPAKASPSKYLLVKKYLENKKAKLAIPKVDKRYSVPSLKNLNKDEQLIVNTCLSDEFKYTDLAQISYILATASHESGSFKYTEEINGRQQAVRLGYRGGANYFGRGYLQLTHDYNYKKIGKVLNVDLLNNPQLVATDKALASRILCLWFTTYQHPIDRHINTNKIDYWTARTLVNGDSYLVGDKIANKAMEYYNKLTI